MYIYKYIYIYIYIYIYTYIHIFIYIYPALTCEAEASPTSWITSTRPGRMSAGSSFSMWLVVIKSSLSYEIKGRGWVLERLLQRVLLVLGG